ncbi:MAG TPA: ABC transporter permease [Gemmatimonadales bacterium]
MTRALGALFRSRRADADVSDEVAHYLEEAAAAHRARGLSPDAARRAARLEVGSPVAIRQEVRSSGWEHVIEAGLRDVRYALRKLRQRPVFSATAIATLAIGIGASTAVFSAVHPILIEPFPFPGADRLVTLDDWTSQGGPMPVTLGTFDEVRARSRSFEALAAADPWHPSLTGSGIPERIEGQRVTAGYFEVFGVIPIAGRGFLEEDDRPGAPKVVILSNVLAVRRFGSAREVVGRDIDLNGDPYLVIGVMPPGFDNVIASAVVVWTPLRERSSGDLNGREWGHHYAMVGRLAPGISAAQASREILAIGGGPTTEFARPAWANLQQGLLIRPLQESITRSATPALYAIVASVLLLLVIASVNVANLLLARAAQRRDEFAMRTAIGAGGRRILQQLLTESMVLALLGGGLGLLVAQLGIRALVAVSPPGLPRLEAIRLSGTAFGFAAGLTALIGLLVGLVPAWGASRVAATEGLQRGSHRSTRRGARTRSALVIAEVGLALTLLVSAGLLFRSVARLTSVAPGFDPSQVITMQVVEAGHGFDSDAARLQFYEQVLEAIRGVPGVTQAGFTSQLPLSGDADGYGYESQAHPGAKPGEDGAALRYAVTPGYFAAMRIPLLAGRPLDGSDHRGAPLAVVINRSFAEQLVGRGNALGQRLRFGPQMGTGQWMEVVGVVGDVKHASLALDAPAAFYIASSQWAWVDNVATLVVRSSGSAVTLVPGLKAAIWAVNPHVPIQRIETMDGFIAASAGNRRFTLLAIEVLAITALLLAAVGLYGVIAGSVAERVREIGVRTALGATPWDVMGQVVRQALALTGAGVAIGLAGGYVASRVIGSMLFGVTGLDPVTYASVIVVMAGTALLAAWAPARRAAGVDPLTALRSE